MYPLLISITEAAALVGISKDRAYALVNSGDWDDVVERMSAGKRMVSRARLLAQYAFVGVGAPISVPSVEAADA